MISDTKNASENSYNVGPILAREFDCYINYSLYAYMHINGYFNFEKLSSFFFLGGECLLHFLSPAIFNTGHIYSEYIPISIILLCSYLYITDNYRFMLSLEKIVTVKRKCLLINNLMHDNNNNNGKSENITIDPEVRSI